MALFKKKYPFSKKLPHFQHNALFSQKWHIFTGLDLKRARSTGLSARRAWRTKSRGPKGLHLEVGARRAPRLLSQIFRYVLLDLSKAFCSISDYLTSTFPEYFWISWFFWVLSVLVTQREHPNGAEDEVKRPKGPPARSRGLEGP